MAKLNQVTSQLNEILNEYSMEVVRATNKAEATVAKEAASKLKNTSPKKTGKYARGWTVKKDKGTAGIETYIVHNKTNYQLTHLLERGHVIRNKKGTYGRTSPQIHIAPVEEWAVDEVVKEIERELK